MEPCRREGYGGGGKWGSAYASTVAGARARVEIWDAESWSTYLAAQEQVFADTAEEIIPGFF